MAAIEIKENEMPVVITNCVSDSVSSIFKKIFGVVPEYDGDDNSKNIGDGVVGIISFVGDASWILMLAFPKDSAETLAEKFCGFEVPYDNPDMGDVIGELANVMAGDIVARMGVQGVKVAMSLPTVLRGQNVEPFMAKGIPDKKMHYTVLGKDVMIKIAVGNSNEMMGATPGA
ncbi:MAG: chemotaxis protein CheX [Nitrospinae bacterium]|nr:chemotaxis protein CheX [Nitrospinota bacterium]